MSQEYVEFVRQRFAAYNRRDVDAMLEGWAPDAVVDWSNSRGLEAGVHRGHDEIRAYMERFMGTFESVRMELIGDPVEVADGVLVAENVAYLRGREGIEIQARSAFLIRIRDGEQTSLTLYQTKQEALEAAGLSEQVMSRENVELATAFFEAYNARDSKALDVLLDPDAEITTLTGRAGLPTRWSRGTTRQYFEQLDETLADLRVDIEAYRELGERVVALGVIRGASKASHVEVADDFAVVFVVRNSRFIRAETYNTWNAALEAARLSE